MTSPETPAFAGVTSSIVNLEGQLAFVTGAGRGIGAAIAQALAAAGAHVLLTARKTAELEEVASTITVAGGQATVAPADITAPETAGRLAQAVGERWGKLDILVLNAGMLGALTPVQDVDGKEWNKVLTTNLLAPQALIAAFHPLLHASGDARVIGVTSSVGAHPRAYWGGYGASKAALDCLLRSYAEEQRHLGRIRVAVVDPGATRTKMREQAFPGEDPASVKPPETVGEAVARLLSEPFETGLRVRI